jgi:hypothetical protein
MEILKALPERLRRVLEQLSGYDLRDVRVYTDSRWPARIGARAFALGSDIHLSPGAEDALEHEAWHVVQQKQGRVRVTRASCSTAHAGLNDDASLEREADTMGLMARHLARRGADLPVTRPLRVVAAPQPVVQCQQVTVSGVQFASAAVFEEEIKTRLALVASNVVDLANIVRDMIDENLDFTQWREVRKEILVREVGYQAVEQMRALAVEHRQRVPDAEQRYQRAVTEAKRSRRKLKRADLDALERQAYEAERIIRWSNPTSLQYNFNDRQMFQWLVGTRNADPVLMNCWEAVLYSLVRTELVDKGYITWCIRPEASGAFAGDLVGLGSPNNMAASLMQHMDYYFWPASASEGLAVKYRDRRIPPAPNDKSNVIQVPSLARIPKGRVLMFGLFEHVALSTGTLVNGEHGLIELDASTETIKEGTIEALKKNYRASLIVAPFPIAPQGTYTVKQEDSEKTKVSNDIWAPIRDARDRKKNDVEQLSRKKVAEIEKMKALSGSLQVDLEQDIASRIEKEQKACREECERLDAEANEKHERLYKKWLSTRPPPVLGSFTFNYRVNNPYDVTDLF